MSAILNSLLDKLKEPFIYIAEVQSTEITMPSCLRLHAMRCRSAFSRTNKYTAVETFNINNYWETYKPVDADPSVSHTQLKYKDRPMFFQTNWSEVDPRDEMMVNALDPQRSVRA